MDENLILELREKYKNSPMGSPGWDVNRCLNRVELLGREAMEYDEFWRLVEKYLESGNRGEIIEFMERVY